MYYFLIFLSFLLCMLVIQYFKFSSEQKRKKYEFEHRLVDIENCDVKFLHDEIEAYAVDLAMSEYDNKHKRIYKKLSNGKMTCQYLADFEKCIEKHYYLITQHICDGKNSFNHVFVSYVKTHYPNSTADMFQNIINKFIMRKSDNTVSENIILTQKTASNNNMYAPPERDELMLHHKFIKLTDINKFHDSFIKHYGFSDISGIYIIFNSTNNKIYIGQGQKAIKRCMTHFKNINDNVPDIKNDWINGDSMFINMIRISDTSFNTLDELERHYISKFNCVKPNGYNSQNGNSTNIKTIAYS